MFLPLKNFCYMSVFVCKGHFWWRQTWRHLHVTMLQCWDKFSNVLVQWSIRMIRVKKYETVSKFVKVMTKIIWPLFIQTRCIDPLNWLREPKAVFTHFFHRPKPPTLFWKFCSNCSIPKTKFSQCLDPNFIFKRYFTHSQRCRHKDWKFITNAILRKNNYYVMMPQQRWYSALR